MGLSGPQRKQLQEALIDAFPTTASLERMLAFRLDKNLIAIAGEGSLQDIVFKLIQAANAEGWVEDLVRAACESNHGNKALSDVVITLLPRNLEQTSEDIVQRFKSNTKIGLKALGYTIKNNVSLNGCTVDIYAECFQPLHVHRIVVNPQESNEKVSLETVEKFALLIHNIQTPKAQPITGLIVSQAGFTKESQDFAEKMGLSLITLDELLKKSFDASKIASYIINSFNKDTLKRVYVNLSCQVTEIGRGTIYKPVEQFFDSFFPSTKRQGIALLGNFGSGKSSLSKHYSYLLAERWVNQNSNSKINNNFLPIYVSLRDLENFDSLEHNLLKLIQSQYEIPATIEGFKYWLKNSHTLIILDGFDEMASKMERLYINKNLEYLQKFSGQYNVKLLLTCRTHFFKTQVEEQALGNMLRLYLLDWGNEELEEYVTKSHPEKKDTSLKTIRSTYNLEELSRTPIFLNMITETIENISGVVNHSKLYQIYTDRWMQNQDYRSRLSPDEKQFFMEELALTMFLTDELRIQHSLLPTKIKDLLLINDYNYLQDFDRDIRTCSFLVRTPEGLYHFVHKSFMEFFVGFRLAKDVKSNLFDNFSKRTLSIEIAGFFVSYFENDIDCIIRGLITHPNPVVRSNFALILGFMPFSKEVFDSLNLSIKIDLSMTVKYASVESLAVFEQEEAVAQKLIELTSCQDEDLSSYCLKKLYSFTRYTKVLDLFKQILLTSRNFKKIHCVLENIAQAKSYELLNEILQFIDTGLWKQSSEVTRALVRVIQSITELLLSQKLSLIEKHTLEQDLLFFIEEVKAELKFYFRGQVEKDARVNKLEKNRRPTNEKLLRQKYGFLIDDEHLSQFMKYLYPVKSKNTRSKL